MLDVAFRPLSRLKIPENDIENPGSKIGRDGRAPGHFQRLFALARRRGADDDGGQSNCPETFAIEFRLCPGRLDLTKGRGADL